MKSSIRKKTYIAIYRLLDGVSPLKTDCGLLCGAVCCTSGDGNEGSGGSSSDEMGIYLLPGEEKIFSGDEDDFIWGKLDTDEYEFPESWHGSVYFLGCKNAPFCDRRKRPIQCRTFPLSPYIDENGVFCMILDASPLPYECPLIKDSIPLEHDFVKATYTVWKHLIRDPLIYDLVEMDSQDLREEGIAPVIVYPAC